MRSAHASARAPACLCGWRACANTDGDADCIASRLGCCADQSVLHCAEDPKDPDPDLVFTPANIDRFEKTMWRYAVLAQQVLPASTLCAGRELAALGASILDKVPVATHLRHTCNVSPSARTGLSLPSGRAWGSASLCCAR